MSEPKPTSPAPPAVHRLHSLDVLRALAVTLVIGRHVELGAGWSPTLAPIAVAWMRGGWVGVDLFFVLSGFLVSGLLFREYRERGTTRIGRFLVRRGLKIYPGFYLMLAATIGQRLWKNGAVPLPAVLCEAFFVQNYGPHLLAHTWSLAVEEHFYLLCSAVVFVLARRGAGRPDPFTRIPLLFAVVAVFCLVARFVTAARHPVYDAWTHSFPTHLRIDGLAFGVCLSYLHTFHARRLEAVIVPRRRLWLALGAALFVPAFVFSLEGTPAMYTLGYTGLYLGSGLLVVGLVLGDLPPTRLVRAISYLGACSYSIYLWHWMARWLVQHAFERLQRPAGTPAEFAVYFVFSFVLGVAAAKLVELPVIRVRDRLFPSRTAGIDAPSLSR